MNLDKELEKIVVDKNISDYFELIAVKDCGQFNILVVKWFSNELNFIFKKYKISVKDLDNIVSSNELQLIILFDYFELFHHNKIKQMFLDEIDFRIKNNCCSKEYIEFLIDIFKNTRLADKASVGPPKP